MAQGRKTKECIVVIRSVDKNDASNQAHASDTESHVLRRRLFIPVDIVFVLVALVCALGVTIPGWLQYAPFAASILFLGLPHGALDHVVPARLSGISPTLRSILAIVLLYGVVGGAVFGLWIGMPAVAFVGFIILTWFHWGQGDLYVLLDIDNSTYLDTRWLRASALVLRGGLPMLVPLLSNPRIYEQVLTNAVSLFDSSAAQQVHVVFSSQFRLLAATLFGGLIVGSAIVTWSKCRTFESRRAWRTDQAETVLLLAFFAFVPPILAVGLYFCLWHALRHIVRLELLDPVSRVAIASGILRPSAWRFARDAAPITVAAVALLCVVAFAVPAAWTGSGPALGLYLVLISALTVPHVLIVSFMDSRQGLWITGRQAQKR